MSEHETGRSTVMNLIGAHIDGRYVLESLLGEGGMGAVYRATDLETQGAVAIKVLLEELEDQPDIRERFEREARALFGLSHPNILAVHDFGLVDGRPYLVMDLLEGGTLDALVEESPVSLADARPLFRDLLEGLAFAHAQGAVHRDLKSENVHVGTKENPKVIILDFGLVKFTDDERWGSGHKLTMMGSVFGTPAYMSPEQCTGAQTDARSDVYAAGVILFEMLTGEWPFMKETRLEMFKAQLMETPPNVSDYLDQPAPGLDEYIARCLEKLPSKRFADAGEMLAALPDGTALPAAPPMEMAVEAPAPSPGPAPATHMRKWLIAGAAALIVLVLAVIAFVLIR
ncbi:MAG: serine/threonine protein kinase [Polyangiales bacterium]|jgi:serine/threonine protein kinase